MKIFLTGGTGFIGSHVINTAHENNIEVLALKRSSKSQPRIQLEKEPQWLQKAMGEVTEEDLKDVDVLVHLAAHSANVPYDNLENCIQYNVIEPLGLFRTAAKAGVSNYVVAGSCFEYGKAGERYEYIPVDAPLEPTQTYPTSKAISSIAFRQFAFETKVNLSYHRIFQVYGEGELKTRLFPSLKRAALSGEDFPTTEGKQVRDFIHVKDVAKKLLLAAQVSTSEKMDNPIAYYNLGSGNPQSVKSFCEYWWEKWGAAGNLLTGEIPYRAEEVMRYVPKLV